MTNLTRLTGKIFGETASPSGDDPEIGQFGSAKAGTYNGTGDVATIQSLSAWSNGWIDAVTPDQQFPTLPEMTGVHKVLSYQETYLLQKGIAEWDSGTIYYTNDFCRIGTTVYSSLMDSNTNHNPTSTNGYWKVALSDDKWHALKSYSDEGELLTDAEGLADVTRYAHSTFDSSKFTVTGSPIITSDGIASGFSSSKYLASVTTLDLTKPYKFHIECKTPASWSDNYETLTGQTSIAIRNYNGVWNVEFGSISIATTHTISLNTDYILDVIYDGTNYSLYSSGTLLGTTTGTPSRTSGVMTYGYYNSTYPRPWGGTINLRETYFIQNGILVFSGNKTGIDTIKGDDYTVVGTPTISDDGVASGFSSSNYLTANVNINSPNSLTIFHSFTTGESVTGETYVYSTTNKCYSAIVNGKYGFTLKDSAQNTIISTNPHSTNVSANTKYFIKYIDDGSMQYLYIKGGSYTDWSLIKSTAHISGTYLSTLQIGNNTSVSNSYFLGSIDLNAFKVYVNGDLVYQPCLKIPYTLSKTGSRIVDSAYRDRVNDMAEQFGYAPYYTLLEGTNFTLPQVELYGLMNTLADGQWINSTSIIANGVTLPTSTPIEYSLATYLPNDGYDYEILFDGKVQTTSTSGGYSALYIFSNEFPSSVAVCSAQTRSSSTVLGDGSAILPVGRNRDVKVGYGAGYTGTFTLTAKGYRRIGKNR